MAPKFIIVGNGTWICSLHNSQIIMNWVMILFSDVGPWLKMKHWDFAHRVSGSVWPACFVGPCGEFFHVNLLQFGEILCETLVISVKLRITKPVPFYNGHPFCLIKLSLIIMKGQEDQRRSRLISISFLFGSVLETYVVTISWTKRLFNNVYFSCEGYLSM